MNSWQALLIGNMLCKYDRNGSVCMRTTFGLLVLFLSAGAPSSVLTENPVAAPVTAGADQLIKETKRILITGDLLTARRSAYTAVQRFPAEPRVFLLLGQIEAKLGGWGQAKQGFLISLRLDPGSADALAGLAEAQFQSGELGLAVETAQRALAADRHLPQAYYVLGSVRRRQQKYSEAIRDLRQSLKLHPKYADALEELGASYFDTGDFARAASAYSRLVRIEPGRPGVRTRLGAVYDSLQRSEAAEQQYLLAIQLNPRDAVALNNLGHINYRRADLKRAISYFEQSCAISPHDAVGYFNLAEAFAADKQHEQAVANYQRAVTYNLKFARAYNNLGYAHEQLQHFEEAQKNYRRALELEPANADYQRNVQTIERKLGR